MKAGTLLIEIGLESACDSQKNYPPRTHPTQDLEPMNIILHEKCHLSDVIK